MTTNFVVSDNICRICLKEKTNMLDIFKSSDDNFDEKITKKIMLCAEVQINANDEFPTQICPDCLRNLNTAFEFRILCEASDATLKKMMIKDSLEAPETIKEEDNKEIVENACPTNSLVIDLKEEPDDNDNQTTCTSPSGDTNFDFPGPLVNGSTSTTSEKDEFPISIVKISLKTDNNNEKKKKVKKESKGGISKKNRKGRKRNNSEDKRTCGVCLRVFKCKMDLYDHERSQNHHAKYPCVTCGKKYSRSYLLVHSASHAMKMLDCEICERSFSHKYELNTHVRRIHNKIELECSSCGQIFNRRTDLIVHIRKHTNEKPYMCETCGKEFFRKDKLLKHRQIHDGIKNYMCDICGRSFRQQPHLKEHVYIHMGIKPYKCDLCNSAFTQKHCLKTHIIMKHKKE